jgi:hypothetical protein
VRRNGWTAAHVRSSARRPRHTYTIGFDETLDHPELIVFDLPARTARGLFADLFRRIVAGELRLSDGDWTYTPRGPGLWLEVHQRRIYEEQWLFFASHRRLARTGRASGLRALQLMLPDHCGAYPWEPEHDPALLPLQPPLCIAFNTEVAADAAV